MQVPDSWSTQELESGASDHRVLDLPGMFSTRDMQICDPQRKKDTECKRRFPLNSCHVSSKRKRHKQDEGSSMSSGDRIECISIASEINSQLLKTKLRNSNENRIPLDTIISNMPYIDILKDVFEEGGSLLSGVPRLQYATEISRDADRTYVDVPIVTRRYEEAFMREALGDSERSCVMDGECECMFIDPDVPFTAMEFLLPNEDRPRERQMCVICLRKCTQKLFYDMVYRISIPNGVVIQRYGNIVNEIGEYSRDACLICPPTAAVHCMPLPIVAHQRNRYSVHSKNGKRYLQQHRVQFDPGFH